MVVESPAKAKTIGRYLGEEYRVLASYGHVIDLPAREGLRSSSSGWFMGEVLVDGVHHPGTGDATHRPAAGQAPSCVGARDCDSSC